MNRSSNIYKNLLIPPVVNMPLSLWLIFSCLWTSLAWGQSLVVQQTPAKLNLNLLIGMVSLEGPNGSLSGLDFGVSVQMPILPRVALDFGGRQGIETESSGLYSAVGAGVRYAPFKTFERFGSNYQLNGRPVAEARNMVSSPLSVGCHARQYFFNGSSNVMPFLGLAVDVAGPLVRLFQVPLSGFVDYAIMKNGERDASVMTAGVGLEF